MSDTATKSVQRLNAQETQQRVSDGAVVIDVRFPFDYAGGRMPGAINLPGQAFRSRLEAVPPGRPLIFVCADGELSPEIAEQALELGYADVSVLEGGFDAWYDQDLPVETISTGVQSVPGRAPVKPGRLSVEQTPLSELLAAPKAKAVLEAHWPKLAEAPLSMISGQTLRAISGFPPAGLDNEKLKAIQAGLDAAFGQS
jgi:rhodanese-related sulfurtransferase